MSAYELDHVAFAVPSWLEAGPHLQQDFAAQWVCGFKHTGFSPCQLELAAGMRLELLEPGANGGGFIADYLASNHGQPKAHHITFKVLDIDVSLAAAKAAGVRTILENLDNALWREAFLHPKDTGLGFLVQLVETNLELDGEDPATAQVEVPCPWAETASSSVQKPAARLDAICGKIRDSSMAQRVLGTVLGGTVEQVDSATETLVFTWLQGSALILEIDPTSSPALHTLAFGDPEAAPLSIDGQLLDDTRTHARNYPALGIGVLEHRHQNAN